MATLYTLSTLNEYTWTCFYGNKQIYISHIAVSKSQAISGLTTHLQQIEYIKRRIADGIECEPLEYPFMNLHVERNKFEYSYSTLVKTTNNKLITIGDLLLNTEPVVQRFRLGTIRDIDRTDD